MVATGHIFEDGMATTGHLLPSHRQDFCAVPIESRCLTEEERSLSVWQLPVHQLLNFNTVPQLTRVTADGTVMLELQSLVIQYFFSRPACSSDPIPLTLAWRRLSQSGNSDMIAEDYHMLVNCYFAGMWDRLDVAAPGDSTSAFFSFGAS